MSSCVLMAETLADALSAVKHAAATTDDRPVLDSIHIERTGTGLRLVAADNYRIATVSLDVDDTDEWAPALLGLDDVPTVVAFLTANKDQMVELTSGGGVLRIATIALPVAEVVVTLRDGAYPDIDKVAPDQERQFIGTFSARYLAGLAKGVGNKGMVRLYMDDPHSPAVFRDPASSYVEVIMPIRDLSLDDALADATDAA